jgi:putative membrane protein insertion efficiency factor
MARISLWLIKGYQLLLSPFLGALGGGCRFTPTCSHYGYEAIRRYGFIKGWRLTILRIGRCHPFTKGGYDPVP